MSNQFSENREPLVLRQANASDAEGMLAIYRPFIENGAITFEVEVPSVLEFQNRVREVQKEAPWLVATSGGRLAGYAYASKHRSRAAYQWTVEVSVYVAREFYRAGVARKLYTELFHLLQQQGYVLALAGITLPNESSVHFHEAMGFDYFATYTNIGYKQGAWHDVGWWQKRLNPFSIPPPSLKKSIHS
jgi:L-amino acid N-acyltransferase YncA